MHVCCGNDFNPRGTTHVDNPARPNGLRVSVLVGGSPVAAHNVGPSTMLSVATACNAALPPSGMNNKALDSGLIVPVWPQVMLGVRCAANTAVSPSVSVCVG
jgi:hypothetical protein